MPLPAYTLKDAVNISLSDISVKNVPQRDQDIPSNIKSKGNQRNRQRIEILGQNS